MVMLEEFRRRKNMKNYYDLMREKRRRFDNWDGKSEREVNYMEFDKEGQESWDFKTTGPERYLEPKRDEIFKPSDFTLIFIDSDSVTNVTRLNRVNHRRVLIWVGNGKGIISYGKGKGIDYENAFDNAFKSLRENMVCINWDLEHTSPSYLEGRHNDFHIKIIPQPIGHYWGNPVIWKMLMYTGLYHCRFSCKSRKREPYSMIYAYMNAVTQNVTLKELARHEGRKI